MKKSLRDKDHENQWRMMHLQIAPLIISLVVIILVACVTAMAGGDAALGTRSYDNYDMPGYCGTSCHTDIYRQWQEAMMSQAYTHHWDEVEYFKLAVPHAEKDSIVAGRCPYSISGGRRPSPPAGSGKSRQ